MSQELTLNARKGIAAGLAVSTILWATMIWAMPAFVSAAPHSDGCLVNSSGTIYLLTGGQKRGFPTAEVFASHGYNFGQVVAANSEDTQPMGPVMVYADGTLVKGPSDPLVYLVANGQKRGFVSGAVYTGLGYSFANVVTAAVNTFADLPTGANLESATERHSSGVLVKDSTNTIWQMTATGRKGVPSMDVFNSYGFNMSRVVAANSADLAAANEGVLSARATCSGDTTPPVSGTLNVSLSGPASSTLINDESQANLANFVFAGSGTVTGVTMQRTGISADTSLTNVYLFDGDVRVSDAASVTSGSMINFTNSGGLFTVNGSKTVAVKADMAASSGETVGVKLTAVTMTSGSVGGLPVVGNNHSIATATLAGADFSTAPTGSGDTDPGTSINVWQGTLSITTRDVTLTRLALRQIGSIQAADIKNFKLMVDGVEVASQAALDGNGYITFTLSKTLTTGSRVLKVVADVIGGSGRTVNMSLRGAYDIKVIDTQYNAAPVVTATGDAFPYDPTAFTVNAGTVTVVKAADSPSNNLTVGASDVPLGRWTVTAYGEAVKVETLTIAVDTTGGTTSEHSLRNGRVLINGAQYGSTTTVAAVDSHASGQSFTVNYMIQPGTPVTVEFRADMFDNEDTNNISAGTVTSIQAAIFGSASVNNAIPQVSLGTLDVPGSTVTANDLSIASGTISLAELLSYPDQTTAVPQSAYKLAAWTLTGNSSEAVNMNTFDVGFVGADAWVAATDLSNVYLKYGGNTTAIKGTVTTGSSTSLANSYSVSFSLGVNETMPIELWGTIASGASDGGGNDTLTAYLRATGVTALSGTTVYADTDSDTDNTDAGAIGQTITGNTGNITATKDASSPVSQLVDDSGTVTAVGWKFDAVTDSYTITDLSFSLGSATAIANVAIKDGTTTVASKPAAATMSFSGLSVPVAANTSKVLTVELTMSTIGVGGGTSASDLTTTMVAFTSRSSSGTSDASDDDTGQSRENNPAGNAMYAYKALPTITYLNLPTTTLLAGTKTLAKFTIDTNGTGTIAWKQMMLEIVMTGATGPALTAFSIYDVTGGGNTQITAAETIQQADNDGSATTCSTDDETCELLILVGVTIDDNVEEQVNGAKTYEVRATVGGTLASGDYVSTTLETYLGHVANAIADTNENDTTVNDTTFLWSDMSASSHDTGTADWTNDNLVKSLPTSTWTMTYPTS